MRRCRAYPHIRWLMMHEQKLDQPWRLVINVDRSLIAVTGQAKQRLEAALAGIAAAERGLEEAREALTGQAAQLQQALAQRRAAGRGAKAGRGCQRGVTGMPAQACQARPSRSPAPQRVAHMRFILWTMLQADAVCLEDKPPGC